MKGQAIGIGIAFIGAAVFLNALAGFLASSMLYIVGLVFLICIVRLVWSYTPSRL